MIFFNSPKSKTLFSRYICFFFFFCRAYLCTYYQYNPFNKMLDTKKCIFNVAALVRLIAFGQVSFLRLVFTAEGKRRVFLELIRVLHYRAIVVVIIVRCINGRLRRYSESGRYDIIRVDITFQSLAWKSTLMRTSDLVLFKSASARRQPYYRRDGSRRTRVIYKLV